MRRMHHQKVDIRGGKMMLVKGKIQNELGKVMTTVNSIHGKLVLYRQKREEHILLDMFREIEKLHGEIRLVMGEDNKIKAELVHSKEELLRAIATINKVLTEA